MNGKNFAGIASAALLGLFACPAQAGWTYLDIDNGIRLEGGAPGLASARPNFNYARACKTAMNVPGIGPLFKVRLEVERNPSISSGSYISVIWTEGAEGPDLDTETNHAWYGAWAGVENYAPIFSPDTFAFNLGDEALGKIQVGRHWRADLGAYRYRWKGGELATC